MSIADAIQEHVAAHLRERGDKDSFSAVARLLGETPATWSSYRVGRTTPNVRKVREWLAALDRAGCPASLRLTSESTSVDP